MNRTGRTITLLAACQALLSINNNQIIAISGFLTPAPEPARRGGGLH